MHSTYKHRHTCRYCRNPEAKDGIFKLHPCILDTGNPCRDDDFYEQLKILGNQVKL